MTTSEGDLRIPQVTPSITIGGRQSKVIVVDYAFGSSRVLYSTAQVFFAGMPACTSHVTHHPEGTSGQIGGRDVLFLYGDSSQAHEAAISFKGRPRIQVESAYVGKATMMKGHTLVTFLPGIEGLITVWDSDQQLVMFSDTDTTNAFWAPMIPTADPLNNLRNYFQFGSNESILVGGPYLVRSARISGSTLALQGDLEKDVRLILIGPSYVRSITWNGQTVVPDSAAQSTLTSQGGFVGDVHPRLTVTGIHVPRLENWRYADSLPEISPDFSDTDWAVANHSTTNIPYPPHYGDGRVLYGCDYGLCGFSESLATGIWLIAAHLVAKISFSGVDTSMQVARNNLLTFQ